MNTYSTSASTPSSNCEALQAALRILTQSGFSILNRDERTATLTGPGLNSTKQNPLLGATKINLAQDGEQLRLDAELGGVDTMRRFLMRFPFLLGLGLGLLFGVVGGLMFGRTFGVGFGVPWAQGWMWMLFTLGCSLLSVSPWFVLSPLIAKMTMTRTQHALHSLVSNAVQLTKSC